MILLQLWMPTWSADSWDTPDTVGFHGLASDKCMHLTVLFVVLFVCLLLVICLNLLERTFDET